jgi:uncharacterized OB-fold protein
MDLSAAIEASSTLERPRVDFHAGKLLGSRCMRCSTAAWPARAVCPRCGAAEMTNVAFNGRGTLTSFTTVWIPRPGLPTPYVLGQVDLDEGVRVFARGEGTPENVQVPARVRIVVSPDPGAPTAFWFVTEMSD